MNLVKITREYFIGGQLRVISNVKFHFPPLNELIFSGVLGQDDWTFWFSETGTTDTLREIPDFSHDHTDANHVFTESSDPLKQCVSSKFFWPFVRSFRYRDLLLRLSNFRCLSWLGHLRLLVRLCLTTARVMTSQYKYKSIKNYRVKLMAITQGQF